jgi:hypothetical protein
VSIAAYHIFTSFLAAFTKSMLKSKAIVKSTAAFNPTFGITAKSSDFEPIEKPREKSAL